MIAERESEIREIETGIHELNDIFRDLGTIVEQQGGLVGACCLTEQDYADILDRQYREQHCFCRPECVECSG